MNLDFKIRFAIDNIKDGIKDETIVAWPALDTKEERPVWLVGRKVSENKVMPLALLLDSEEAVKRFAPEMKDGEYDFTQIQK